MASSPRGARRGPKTRCFVPVASHDAVTSDACTGRLRLTEQSVSCPSLWGGRDNDVCDLTSHLREVRRRFSQNVALHLHARQLGAQSRDLHLLRTHWPAVGTAELARALG